MTRIDILIERARQRAIAERAPNAPQGAATSGDQVEYLVRSGLLTRCAICNRAVEPGETTVLAGNPVCADCYPIGADFQDTAPGYAP